MEYDESITEARLARLDRASRTAFAAACAERLFPLFERYSRAGGEGDPEALRVILDAVWRAARGEEVNGLAQAAQVAEGMMPDEDGYWIQDSGYAQNAAAAVGYAAMTWLASDLQVVIWGGQVYDAAYYAAHFTIPDFRAYTPKISARLARAEVVCAAISGIFEYLAMVESDADPDWSRLREKARGDGARWTPRHPSTPFGE